MKQNALRLGFQACGVAAAACIDEDDLLGRWIDNGLHASMGWLARSKALRQDVRLKLPGAKSVIVLARNYYRHRPSVTAAARGRCSAGRVARYAWGRDYHRVLRRPLRQLANHIEDLEEGALTYCSIDSGPVMERAWAARAGVGAIGKNSLALRRDIGSWFFLATVITNVEFTPDAPAADLCGTCRACLDACPTGAIVAPYVVDSARCISYQTIENRGDVPADIASKHGDWVFGCDICQEVCPWNRFATPTTEEDFAPRPGHANPTLEDLAHISEERFREEFNGTPILRAKWSGIRRNAKIALTNLRARDREGERTREP